MNIETFDIARLREKMLKDRGFDFGEYKDSYLERRVSKRLRRRSGRR